MNLSEFLPGVYQIDLRVSNCFLIIEESRLILIDAGVRRSFNVLVDVIRSLGYSPDQLTSILLTHADLDHVGAASALKEHFSVRIYASQVEADALAQGRSSRQVRAGLLSPFLSWLEHRSGAMQVQVDQTLAQGDQLPFLGGLQVISTPGHTPGHLSFYAPRDGLLFAGDSVSTRSGHVGYNRVKIFNWDEE